MAAPGEKAYASQVGTATTLQVAKAVREFERRVRRGDQDVEVVVATRVPIQKWQSSDVARVESVVVQARYVGDAATAATTVDLFITNVPGDAHVRTVGEVCGQLREYATSTGKLLTFGSGTMDLVVPGSQQQHSSRCPDASLQPAVSSAGEVPVAPRLIVQVEVRHRTLAAAQRFCREYFELIPELRAVLLLHFFGRDATTRAFACVAILYRRIGAVVVVADVVRFGSASLARAAENAIEQTPARRDLPLVPVPTPLACPWTADQRPMVCIPADDVLCHALGPRTDAIVRPGSFRDLDLDLWKLYQVVDTVVDF